jgi:hypothetical protein
MEKLGSEVAWKVKKAKVASLLVQQYNEAFQETRDVIHSR